MSAPNPRHVRLRACTVDLLTGELSGGRTGTLSERERTLLGQLVAQQGEVVSHEVLNRAFGYATTTTTRAVDKAMNTLRRKVEANSRNPEHLLTRRGVGYLFVARASVGPKVGMPDRLPNPPTSFVGRLDELATVVRCLEHHRLVSLVGLGGAGKTRLAIRAASAASTAGESTWFVDLSDARGSEGLARAMARSLESPGVDDPGEPVARILASRGSALLVLDNAETVNVALAAVLPGWLAAAPELRVLVTSREPTRVDGETLVVLGPMTAADAFELYLERARASLPGFTASPEDNDILPRLLELLDHLPLAIELAAARVRVLRPAQLFPRLSDRFQILSARQPSVRQPSLRAILDWSFEQLSDDERSTLVQLLVFQSPFSLEAAEAVLDVPTWVAETLQSLMERGWLTASGPDRLALLVTIRDYVQRFASAEPLVEARYRHALFFGRAGRELCAGRGVDPGPLVQVVDDTWAACCWGLDHGQPEIAAHAFIVTHIGVHSLGPYGPFVELGDRVADLELAPVVRSEVTRRIAQGLTQLGRLAEGMERNAEALLAARESRSSTVELRALRQRGELLLGVGRIDEAEEALAGALEAAQASGSKVLLADALVVTAWLHTDRGRLPEASADYRLAASLYAEVGRWQTHARTLVDLASSRWRLGALTEARETYERARELYVEHRDRVGQAVTSGYIGGLLIEFARYDDAITELEAVLPELGALGLRRYQSHVLHYLALAHLGLGNVSSAHARLLEELEQRRAEGSERDTCLTWVALAEVARKRGNFDEAVAHSDRAHGLASRLGLELFVALATLERARIAIARSDPARALALVSDAVPILERIGEPHGLAEARMVRAEALLLAGARVEAQLELERAQEELPAENAHRQHAADSLRRRLVVP